MISRSTTFLLILVLLGCGTPTKESAKEELKEEIKSDSESQKIENNGIEKKVEPNLSEGEVLPIRLNDQINGKGVLVMKSEPDGLSLNDTLTVLNDDGTTYLTWCYEEEYLNVESYNLKLFEVTNEVLANYEIKPRAFYPEYQVIHFEVIAEKENYYEIIVSPKSNTIKRIPKTSNWTFYTWEEYLQTVYLMYDVSNPLRAEPNGDAQIIYEFNDYYFRAIEIKGDWVRIQCNDDCKKCDKGVLEGWIKWKDENKLLVSLGIIC